MLSSFLFLCLLHFEPADQAATRVFELRPRCWLVIALAVDEYSEMGPGTRPVTMNLFTKGECEMRSYRYDFSDVGVMVSASAFRVSSRCGLLEFKLKRRASTGGRKCSASSPSLTLTANTSTLGCSTVSCVYGSSTRSPTMAQSMSASFHGLNQGIQLGHSHGSINVTQQLPGKVAAAPSEPMGPRANVELSETRNTAGPLRGHPLLPRSRFRQPWRHSQADREALL